MGVLDLDYAVVAGEIGDFIAKTVAKAKSGGVVVGLSGGVDSATVAFLCVKALGREKVFGLVCPFEGITSASDVSDAIEVAKVLSIEYEQVGIRHQVESFSENCRHRGEERIAFGNLQARVRMVNLYWHANKLRRLVAGTGNKSELLLGYFTKYGDGGVDFLPLGDLYKTQVFGLAKHLGVPAHVVEKTPSAGLWADQSDEKELGLSYEVLDSVLEQVFEEKLDPALVASKNGLGIEAVNKILERVSQNTHKISTLPVPRIGKKTVHEISLGF